MLPRRVSTLRWWASSDIRTILLSRKSSIETEFSLTNHISEWSPCIVVKQIFIAFGSLAWKLLTSRILTFSPSILISSAKRYFDEVRFKKFSFVFFTILDRFTKNRKFLYPCLKRYSISPAIISVFPLPVAIWKSVCVGFLQSASFSKYVIKLQKASFWYGRNSKDGFRLSGMYFGNSLYAPKFFACSICSYRYTIIPPRKSFL